MKRFGCGITKAAVSAALTVTMTLGGVPVVAFAESSSSDSTTSASGIVTQAEPTNVPAEKSSESAQETSVAMQGSEQEGQAAIKDENQQVEDKEKAPEGQQNEGEEAGVASQEEQASEAKIEGTWGTCKWDIVDGTLTVHPGTGAERKQGIAFTWPWEEYSESIKHVVFAEENGAKVVAPADISGADQTSSLVSGLSGTLESVDLSGLDVSAATSLMSFFQGCALLKTVTFGSCDTSTITSMSKMFSNCSALETLDASSIETKSVTDFSEMFYGCMSLKSLDVAKWDVSSGENFTRQFFNCEALGAETKDFDVSAWNVTSGKDFQNMFSGCKSIKSFDFSRWDTSNAETVAHILGFSNTTLERISLGEKTTKFQMCKGLDVTMPSSPYTITPVAAEGWWFSQKEKTWFAGEEIDANRLGIADTYTKTEEAEEVTPARKVATRVNIANGAPQIDVTNFDDIAFNLLSDSEKERFNNGEDATVWLDVSVLEEGTSGYALFQSALTGQNITLGAGVSPIYDIKLWKKVGDDAATEIHDTGENALHMALHVPEDHKGKDENVTRTFTLHRVHFDTQNAKYSFDEVAKTSNDPIEFDNSKFSWFYFNYLDAAKDSGNGGSGSTTNVTTSSPTTGTRTTTTTTTTPTTGDPTTIGMVVGSAVVGLAACGIGVRNRRRK